MPGRRMLGKIQFKLEAHLGNVRAPAGYESIMGQKDFVLCGIRSSVSLLVMSRFISLKSILV